MVIQVIVVCERSIFSSYLLWLVLATTIYIHQPLFPLTTGTLLTLHHHRVPRRLLLPNLPHLHSSLPNNTQSSWFLVALCAHVFRDGHFSIFSIFSIFSASVDSMLLRVFNWLSWLFELLVVGERPIFFFYLLWFVWTHDDIYTSTSLPTRAIPLLHFASSSCSSSFVLT